MFFEPRLEAFQDIDGLFNAGFRNIDLLETPRKRMILFKDSPVFLVGRRPDATNLAVCEHRLDQVTGVHDATRSRAGTDHRVDLVDEQNRAGVLLNLLDDPLKTLLEISAILGSCDQRTHVERVNRCIQQHLRYAFLGYHPGQSLSQCGFADARVADIQGIVLAPPTKNLHGSFDLDLAADQRVDLAVDRLLIKVGRISVQRRYFRLHLRIERRLLFLVVRPFARQLRHTVGHVIDDIEPGDVLQVQEVNSLRLLFAEYGDKHVAACHFLLTAGLDVEYRALQYSLEPECRLNVGIIVVGK